MAVILRQVERFTVSFASGDSSKTHTLSTTLLDTAKAFLVFGLRNDSVAPATALIRGQITNTTTVTFNRAGTGVTAEVVGYVVEFTAGVSVQRGTDVLVGVAGVDVTLTGIDLVKSFHLISSEAAGGTYNANEGVVSYLFDDSGTKKIHLQTNSDSSDVDWQVIEYDDCAVQRGSVTSMGSGTGSVTAALSAINLAKSWLRLSARHASGTSADIGEKLLRGRFTSTTQITLDRDNTGVVISDIRWEVIEFTGTEVVEEVLSSFIATDGQNDETIAAVSALTKTIALASWIQRGGKGAHSADDIPGESWYTLDLTTTTNLQIKRDSTSSASDVAAYVIDFGVAAPDTIEIAPMLSPTPRWDRKMRIY